MLNHFQQHGIIPFAVSVLRQQLPEPRVLPDRAERAVGAELADHVVAGDSLRAVFGDAFERLLQRFDRGVFLSAFGVAGAEVVMRQPVDSIR